MKKQEENSVRAKLIIKTLITTSLALVLCVVSLGVGHGSGFLFKLLFPLPYTLFELIDLRFIADSVFAMFIPGLFQFGIYFVVVERLKTRMSEFLSHVMVLFFHSLFAIGVAIAFE